MSDLHTDLRALTSDQPMQPGDRLAGVTGKARRIRRVRAAVSVAAVLAVAAPIGLLVLPDRGASTASYAGMPVTSWPDRSRPEKQGVAAGAVALFEANGGNAAGMRWLYRGQVGTTDDYVVAFVAEKDGVPTVVIGTSQLSQEDSNGLSGREANGSYPWALHEQPVATVKHEVSTFLNSSDASTPSVLFPGQQVPDFRATLVVIGDPNARRLTWTADPLPFAPTEVTPSGVLTSSNGIFLSTPLRLNGLPTARLENSRGALGTPAVLGALDNQPNLVLPEPPVAQELERDLLGGSSSTTTNTGVRWSGASYGFGGDLVRHRFTTFVRCYGGGRLVATVEENNPRPGQVVPSEAAPCDGQTHEVLKNLSAPTADSSLSFSSDRLQVLSFVTRKS